MYSSPQNGSKSLQTVAVLQKRKKCHNLGDKLFHEKKKLMHKPSVVNINVPLVPKKCLGVLENVKREIEF